MVSLIQRKRGRGKKLGLSDYPPGCADVHEEGNILLIKTCVLLV